MNVAFQEDLKARVREMYHVQICQINRSYQIFLECSEEEVGEEGKIEGDERWKEATSR